MACSAFSTLTAGVSETTWIVSGVPAMPSFGLNSIAAPTGTMTLPEFFAKPASSAETSYCARLQVRERVPAVRIGDARAETPVPVLVAVTVAPGSTPPCSSMAVPLMRPVSVCASASAGTSSTTASSIQNARHNVHGLLDLIASLLWDEIRVGTERVSIGSKAWERTRRAQRNVYTN